LDAFKLALERAVVLEGAPPNDFQRAQGVCRAAREPDFAIRTTAYAPKLFVVRDGRRLDMRQHGVPEEICPAPFVARIAFLLLAVGGGPDRLIGNR